MERRIALFSARIEEASCIVGGRALQYKKWGLLVCLGLPLAMSNDVRASELNPFVYDGSQETLLGLMQNEAGTPGGAGAFEGAGFYYDMVNVFIADLSGAGSDLSNAGVTLFVMWGNGDPLGADYRARVSFNDSFSIGSDGVFTEEGTPQVFALGEGVAVSGTSMILSSAGGGLGNGGGIGESDVTPRGFAITNLQNMSAGDLHLTFIDLSGSITTVGLFDYGDSIPEMLLGDDAYITMPLVIPLPPPLGLALVGLVGVAILRRRLIRG